MEERGKKAHNLSNEPVEIVNRTGIRREIAKETNITKSYKGQEIGEIYDRETPEETSWIEKKICE